MDIEDILDILWAIIVIVATIAILVSGIRYAISNHGRAEDAFYNTCYAKGGKILRHSDRQECWYPAKDGPLKIDELWLNKK